MPEFAEHQVLHVPPHHYPRESSRRAPSRVIWGWASIPLVVLGIIIPAIQTRDGGAIGLISRSTALTADAVGLVCLGLLLAGIVAGFLGRGHRQGRVSLWIGLGYLAVALFAALLFSR